jgi:cysteinyl-tRNA synthetase
MIDRGLGHIDLHSGGIDLRFPHHENEIAQGEAHAQSTPWCPQFIHVGHVKLGGEKMSKSLGNVWTVSSVLDRYNGDSSVLRMLCLSKAYASDFELSLDLLDHAQAILRKIRGCVDNCRLWCAQGVDRLAAELAEGDTARIERIGVVEDAIREALGHDFGTPKALHLLLEAVGLAQPGVHPLVLDRVGRLLADVSLRLGLDLHPSTDASFLAELVRFRARAREVALETRSPQILALCDQLRHDLGRQGVDLQDTRGKPASHVSIRLT